jgi:hypothetical protein
MFVVRAGVYQLGFGIWTAPFFLIAGGLGVYSAKTKNTCPIVGCMVMSILSILVAVVVFACGGSGLSQDNMFNNECKQDRYGKMSDPYFLCNYFDRPDNQSQLDARIAMNVINIIAGVAEFFIALVQSVFCCKGTCCGGRTPQQQIIVYQPTPQAVVPQSQVPYNPQQPVVYPAQQAPVQQQPYQAPVQQPYGGGMPMQGRQQYAPQQAPPPINPEFAAPMAHASAPPSYDEVASMTMPPKL